MCRKSHCHTELHHLVAKPEYIYPKVHRGMSLKSKDHPDLATKVFQVSDQWHPIFEEYKKMEVHPCHLTLVGSLILLHLHITWSGQVLIMEHRTLPNNMDVPVSQHYQFSSKAEAISWY